MRSEDDDAFVGYRRGSASRCELRARSSREVEAEQRVDAPGRKTSSGRAAHAGGELRGGDRAAARRARSARFDGLENQARSVRPEPRSGLMSGFAEFAGGAQLVLMCFANGHEPGDEAPREERAA